MILPDWDAPDWVRAVSTTRRGGNSQIPYAEFNLALHVGDDEQSVLNNRQLLYDAADLPAEPKWLEQVHSRTVVQADQVTTAVQADGSFTTLPNIVCVVMTADCLPVLLVNRKHKAVAALHAGWKGLAAGILEQGVKKIGAEDTIAWLGPAIGPKQFEVGDDVYHAFVDQNAEHKDSFAPYSGGKWLANLYELAQRKLTAVGVGQVFGGNECTYTNDGQFYSYRRDRTTGRMASLIWIAESR